MSKLKRKSPADKVRTAIIALAEHQGQVLTHSEKVWASITFAGTRHSLSLLFAGEDAVAAGERFIKNLPEHEFAIPGQLCADADIAEVEHRLHPTPRLVATIDLLMLED